MTTIGRGLAQICACLALSLGAAHAQPAPPPPLAPVTLDTPVVTQHRGVFNGKRVSYQARVEAIDLPGQGGGPGVRLVTTAYVATGPLAGPGRPVMFVFNGGPISPSPYLHMGAFGPKRLAVPDDLGADPASFQIVDNPYTILDVADLVFFDPAGTGFSRFAEGVDPQTYFSVEADARQLTDFVVAWSKAHGREASPKYLFGESYGTIRAAVAAAQIQKLPQDQNLQGAVFMGQAMNIVEYVQRPQNIISYVVSLPTLAATAWWHGKADLKGQDFEAWMDEMRLFARTEYLTALAQGDDIDPATREAVARKLEAYSGIPAAFYVENNLRITKERYRVELLKDQGLTLGMADARYTGPSAQPGQRAVDPSRVLPEALISAFEVYARDTLKVGDIGDYSTRSPVTAGWRYAEGAASPFTDYPFMRPVSEVFALNPTFRVLMANGHQDTQTTTGAMDYGLALAGWPKDRASARSYQGGHMAYSVEASLAQMMADVRAFVTAAP
ncbi:S10 family peptidase [Phenylobacterium sp.]|uniref:S10 family peptidase n=1 Tax=Phenylobacterium sp. TaxID=1871053 RepID=UPI002730897E|nr:hypothetical protein [Phenylobacterium sp.]MDP1875882.1 hypothetical protein [Phenylobacterium sp.]